MPAHSKLTNKHLETIKQLIDQQYNLSQIAKELGFARDTIKKWCKENNLQILNIRRDPENYKKYQEFKNICRNALQKNEKIKLNQTLRELNLHADSAQRIIRENPEFKKVIRAKNKAIAEDKTLSIKDAQLRLPDESHQILGFSNGKYKIQATDGFVYYKTSAKLNQGDPRGKSGTPRTLEDIECKLIQIDYELVRDSYTIKRNTLQARHTPCGQIRENRFDNFFVQDCPVCSNNGVSNAELEILEWVQQYYPSAHSTRTIIKPKEIDIYIPELKLGIEYCGLYWHNQESLQPKDRKYHQEKMILCNEQGVRLITIFEDEWLYREQQVKNYLKSVLNISEQRIYARKCNVIEVDKQIARQFLEDNHIQGKTTFKIAFGLYYQEQLVGVVTGNCHHRKSEEFVLNRLVFADGVQVLGGASKLLKHLIKYAKEQQYNYIISWSDNRWSEGNVYEKVGFTMDGALPPDYSYYNSTSTILNRQSKQSNKKANLIKKGADGTHEGNTEYELALTLGLYRIWDCGKKRFVIKL